MPDLIGHLVQNHRECVHDTHNFSVYRGQFSYKTVRGPLFMAHSKQPAVAGMGRRDMASGVFGRTSGVLGMTDVD